MNNTLYTGDNLYILSGTNSNSVDLVYLDPPFNSKRIYSAPIDSKSAGASFKDMWKWSDVDESYLESLVNNYPALVKFIESIGGVHSKAMMAYVTYMTQRLIEIHRVLKNTGSIYLHVDPTASHYLKIVLDEIFGKDNFQNEVIWHYQTGGASKKWFAKKHDVILIYNKSDNYYINLAKVKMPRTEKSLDRASNPTGARFSIKDNRDKLPMDVWSDIPSLNSMSKERTGYPTQKPETLLRRIIEASSKEGDIVLDPFCGCATTCVAAQQLKRKWIGIDIEEQASKILIERLSDDAGFFKDFIHRTDIPQRTDINKVAPSTPSIKRQLFKAQEQKCNGCRTEMEIRNLEIDHIIPKSKGGGDYYENYQLLCSNCNRIKGDRPMEYLRNKIRKIQELMRDSLTFGE